MNPLCGSTPGRDFFPYKLNSGSRLWPLECARPLESGSPTRLFCGSPLTTVGARNSSGTAEAEGSLFSACCAGSWLGSVGLAPGPQSGGLGMAFAWFAARATACPRWQPRRNHSSRPTEPWTTCRDTGQSTALSRSSPRRPARPSLQRAHREGIRRMDSPVHPVPWQAPSRIHGRVRDRSLLV